MAKYPNIKLTQKGLDMAINADKSKKLIYTHIGIGDGRLANNEDILTLTAMKSRKIYADISDINNDTNNQVTIETVVSNKVVNEGFYAREIGIYAKLGNTGQEVLCAYANAGDNADYMPDKSQPIDELKLRITLIVGNVDNVTAVINSSIIFITLADCRREIARHNADPLAHGDFARKKDYYTKAQTDAKLNGKANTAHGNHVPTTEQANNARFLRNDNTWQTITPNNIGAYHKNETYHKNEVNTITDQKMNTRVSKSGDTMTANLRFEGANVGLTSSSGYIQFGGTDTGDAIAGGNGANVNIGSLYGIGFYSIQTKKYTGSMDLRNGDWRTVGSMTANKFVTTDGYRCLENNGLFFEKYGGGWYMSDDTWIRANGNKSIFTAGKIKADGGFEGKASSAGRADSSVVSDRAVRVENGHKNMRFHWSCQGGQPTWLWGGNDGENMYVYNPSNFTVSRANTAGTADNSKKIDGRSLSNILGLIDAANTGAVEARLEENGYIKLRNGLIIQWGKGGGGYSGRVNFPIAFSRLCVYASAGGVFDGVPTNPYKCIVITHSITKEGFSYQFDDIGGNVQFIAIGI
jgi:hypothetical protein